MGHRLDIASGKNEFNRRLGNFRVQIKLDDEGEHVAAVTASILAPRHLSEHQRSCGIPSTVDIFTPAPDALGLAVSILRAAQDAGLTLPAGLSVHWASSNSTSPHCAGSPGVKSKKGGSAVPVHLAGKRQSWRYACNTGSCHIASARTPRWRFF
jgi:hypothetical protein